jgi:drug/metabolite transporter (DMT)-like permease
VVSGLIIGVAAVVTAQPLGAGVAAEWPTFALIALVPGTIGHLLITWAHPRIHAAASSAVTLGVPVVASLGTWALIGEAFGPWQAAGGVIALGCAAAAMRHLPSTGLAVAAERYGEVAS